MSMTGPDLFPEWLSLLWVIVFAVLAIYSAQSLPAQTGPHRYHVGLSLIMSVSMGYMFLAMAVNWTVIPPLAWLVVFGSLSVAVVIFLVKQVVSTGQLPVAWVLSLVATISMIVMGDPDGLDVMRFIFFTILFAEVLGWLTGTLDLFFTRSVRIRPGKPSLTPRPVVPGSGLKVPVRVEVAVMSLGMSHMLFGQIV